MDTARFLQELIRRQGHSRGREFARRLGISESYWSLLRRGERPITFAVIERAIREFPDLELLPTREMLENEPLGEREAGQLEVSRWRRQRFNIRRILVNGTLAAIFLVGLLGAELSSLNGSVAAIYAADKPTKADAASEKATDKKKVSKKKKGKPSKPCTKTRPKPTPKDCDPNLPTTNRGHDGGRDNDDDDDDKHDEDQDSSH